MFAKRSHTCGELRKGNIGEDVTLNGWVQNRRDHGGLIFIDLRDRYGLTQIVFDPKEDKESHKKAEGLRREDVISVKGKVRARGKGLENPKLDTGEIEVLISGIELLSKAETPPIEIDDRIETSEEVKLKYRYLDLRKPGIRRNILFRHKVIKAVRDFFDKEGFVEIETPVLAKATPEGARDFLVPSRLHPGKFYALPQSPQIFKQILMISGFDRYMQIVKCFRDEDLRADRQPEFTQIDLEQSFIEEEDIYAINERFVKYLWKTVMGIDLKLPFLKLTYEEAVGRYGLDKPDLRFGLELVDMSDIAARSDFQVFKEAVSSGGTVKCINAKGCASFSRKDIEELTHLVTVYDAKGLAWMKMDDKLESSVVKFFSEDLQKEMIKAAGAEKGDLLLFVADKKHFIVNTALGHLRNELAKKLGLIEKGTYNFLWVTDFPLLEYDEDEERHVSVHHPFTSPKEEDLKFLDTDPSKVRSKAYDLVLNGTEIAGGSIRIHDTDIQKKMFSVLGIGEKEAEKKFGFLLEALRYGTPPHGGIAYGIDRLIAIMLGLDSIRDVIAFPKNKAAQGLMDGCPSDVSAEQLKDLNIKLK